jgi:hypothetical protein
MTHDQGVGEAVNDTLSAGGSAWDEQTRLKLEEKDRKREIEKAVEKAKEE